MKALLENGILILVNKAFLLANIKCNLLLYGQSNR